MRFLAIFLLAILPLLQATTVEELEEKLTRQFERKSKMQESLFAKELEEKVTRFDKEMSEMKAGLRESFERRVRRLEEFVARSPGVSLSDTDELEGRVSVLEESVADLEAGFLILTDDLDNIESDNILQDQRLNTMEAEILDNDNDIEDVVSDIDVVEGNTVTLGGQVTVLDQRVTVLESGGGGGDGELEERVETLEEVTSELATNVSELAAENTQQDGRISSIEEDMTSVDQRVEDLESGEGGNVTAFGDTISMADLKKYVNGLLNPLIFDRHVINLGDHYNTTTGKYTVPYDGIYQFFVNICNNADIRIDVHVDDAVTHNDQYANSYGYYRSFTFLQQLSAGQTVHVVINSVSGGADGESTTMVSYFGGYMIKAN